jgi:hypothetical protein
VLTTVLVLVSACALLACSSGSSATPDRASVQVGEAGRVVVHTDQPVAPFDHRLLGTNVPAWLLPQLVADEQFRALTVASGTTLLRLPGGSWSNGYHWLGCEQGDPGQCDATWGMTPSDFVDLLESTGLPGMWTAAFSGTAQEAAAAVAFFNGEVDDQRPIGVDRRGRDWLTVGHWAQLRADGGHPRPAGIHYWEVGNEIYGAAASAGPNCAAWGWENVWTCDPAAYVQGDAEHDGYLQFHQAMTAVDPTIEVGAVGVGDRGEWSNWDDEVIADAGDAIDFYVVHQYGSDGDVPASKVLALPAKAWPAITQDVSAAFADHGLEEPTLAVTEHNLVAFIDGDNDRLMTTALNAFYLAETIGQMAEHGVGIANQWNLANGRAPNGSDYGLFDATTHERSPAYYALALWARFGDELVQTDVGSDLDQLVVYGGRTSDGRATLMVLNPTSKAIDASVSAASGPADVRVDQVVTGSLDSTSVTFNGATDPSLGLTEPGQTLRTGDDGSLATQFPAYSITLVSWTAQA